MKRLCPFEGYFIISMPGHAVPVRVRRGIVAIRARQAAVSTVIQVATAPRGVHARRTGRIERSHTPLHYSKNNRLVAMVNHRHKREKSSTGVSGGYTPSMCLRHIFTLSFCPIQQAGARRTRTRTPGKGCQARKAGRSKHRHTGRHRAKGRTRPPNWAKGTQPVHR